jgi:hypothetical protein
VTRYIPCPVCGGTLTHKRWPHLEGGGYTAPFIDCEQRHHSTTEPHVYEALRLQAVMRDIEETTRRLREERHTG